MPFQQPDLNRSNRFAKQFSNLAPAAAIFGGIVGGLALLGWFFDVTAFRSLLPDLAETKFNTAVCLVLAAGSLWLLGRPALTPRRRLAASVLAGLVIAISAATLAQYLFGIDLGIDQLVTQDQPDAPMTSSPGRMAPNTAAGLAAVGLALLASARPTERNLIWLTLLAGLSATMALIGLVGYLYSATTMYRLASFTGMSLVTALGIFSLSLGALASAPQAGPMRLLRSAGPEGKFVRVLLPAVVLVPLILGWLRIEADRGELISAETGVAVMSASVILILAIVLFYGALQVEKLDMARTRATGLFRSVVDASPNGLIMVGEDGRIALANPRTSEIFGYGPGELAGMPIDTLLPRESVLSDRGQRADLLRNGQSHPLGAGTSIRSHRRDGSEMFLEVGLNPIVHEGQTFVLASVIDISERKQIEDALRVSEHRLRTLFETVRLIVVSIAADGTIQYVNPYLLSLSGYSEDQLVGKNWFEIFVPEDERERRQADFSATLSRGPIPHEPTVLLTREGHPRLVSWHTSLLRDSESRVVGILNVGEDVTEQKSLEAQYQQAQKMEAVGRLAAGVAHDFNNILTVILAMCELKLEQAPGGSDPEVEEIRSGALRASTLTRQLLTFSRQQVLEPKVLNVNSVIGELQKMLTRVLGEDVVLRTILDPNVGTVRMDQGQLEQALVNLAVNARDAMPTGGTLSLETANATLDATYASEHAEVEPGEYVMIAVTDSGVGMDSWTQSQIFQPFFTTKEVGKGTGLGLSTVWGAIRQSDGYVWVYSEPGHGTCFKIYLPRVGTSSAMDPGHLASPAHWGDETILLVEDDARVRQGTRRLLEARGYRVIDMSSGEEALQFAREHPDPLPLLITDVVMPEMSGPELVRELTGIWPSLRVLYISGYTGDAVIQHGLLTREVHFLQKPFTLAELSSTVRAALDETVDPATRTAEPSV